MGQDRVLCDVTIAELGDLGSTVHLLSLSSIPPFQVRL